MAKKTNGRGYLTYKTYVFRDKDPVIDAVRTARKEAGLSFGQLHNVSNVSVSTLRNWEVGKTRRPQFATIAAAARGIGPEAQRAVARLITRG